MTSLKSYLHQHFGLDAGHAIMSLLLGVIALTTTNIFTNIIVASGVGLFFGLVATNSKQSLLKNIIFSSIITLSVFIALTIMIIFQPGQYFPQHPFVIWPSTILPAILAGSFSYMIPKEIYDMTNHLKFKIHIDNITDALSYQLLSWPVLYMLGGYPFLALTLAIFWFAFYILILNKKIESF